MSAKIHLVKGTDEFAVDRKAREIVDKLVPAGQATLGLEIVDGGAENTDQAVIALQRCTEAAVFRGLLAEGKVIWFRGVKFLGGQTGRTVGVKEAVASFSARIAKDIPDGHVLVISVIAADDSSPLFAACKGGEVVDLDDEIEARDGGKPREANLAGELARRKLRMSSDVTKAFLERVGEDSRLVVTELDKMEIYLDSRKEITREDVELMIAPMGEIQTWDLADAFGRRELGRAIRIARQLFFQKESIVGLLAGLERRVRDLILMRRLIDAKYLRIVGDYRKSVAWSLPPDAEETLASLGKENPKSLHPYRCLLLAQQAAMFRMSELIRCRDAIFRAHSDVVTVSNLPDSVAMELLLIRTLAQNR